MIRYWKHIGLALAIQLGLGATFASAQPLHFAPTQYYAPAQPLSGQYQMNGTITNRGNFWDNGSNWGNSPPVVNVAQYAKYGGQYGNRIPNIAGVYTIAGRPAEVRQRGHRLLFINEWGSTSEGRFLSPTLVQAYDWDHGLTGVLTHNGIEWANGTVWWSRR
jgi:hypothetical protein